MIQPTTLLCGIPLFSELSEKMLANLAKRCVTRKVSAGFRLFSAGEHAKGLYLIAKGRVRVFRTASDGRKQTVMMEGPGKSIAELPLLDGEPYPASAETTMDSELVFLPKQEFEHAIHTNPEAAEAVIRSLGKRMRQLVQVIETISFKDVAARLAMLLAEYAGHDGVSNDDGSVSLVLAGTQDDIAHRIGTARESVSRAFKQLAEQGLIKSRSGRRLVLVAPDRLRAWALDGRR